MTDDGPPPRLRSNTLRQRAAQSGEIYEARRRARSEIADRFETVEPGEIPLRNEATGVGAPQSFFERAEPREAAFQLNPAFPRQDLTPADVERTDKGFRAAEPVRRQSAAYELDPAFPEQDLTPADVRETDDGFGVAESIRRQSAAFEFEAETPLMDVDPDRDVQAVAEGGFGLSPTGEQRLAARRFEDTLDVFGAGELGASDVEPVDDGFQLIDERQREVRR